MFNILDARGAISVTERAAYMGRIRNLARSCAEGYVNSRDQLGYPMLDGPDREKFITDDQPAEAS